MRLDIPRQFLTIRFDYDRHPRSAEFDFNQGANCQLYAYALLRHFGVEVPPFRSSELWEDEMHTRKVSELQPLDLLLFNRTDHPWGAHVAVHIGDERVIHLSRKVGVPAIAAVEEMLLQPEYRIFIGAKRANSRARRQERGRPSPRSPESGR